MSFNVEISSGKSRARVGGLATNHGVIETPFFMPIATQGSVKHVGTDDLETLGASILLSNTYHLMLRPGVELLRAAGGLHGLMNWSRPILTDSGGYQVFSLADLRKMNDEGVTFRSHIDGSEQFLSPEKSMEVQSAIGSDIVMTLDECTPYPVSEEGAQNSLEMTLRWAERSKKHYAAIGGRGLLFGIQQGSTYANLRDESARRLVEIGFDGYAVGGLSIGEPREETYALVEKFDTLVPRTSPRYFMGAGKPEEIVEYVKRGIDMFDCVMPTRNARHGLLYCFTDRNNLSANSHELADKDWYETMHITNERFKQDFSPIDAACGCPTCRRYSRAYLRHLFSVNEPLGQRLATLHNLYFYLELMRRIRESVRAGSL